MPIVLDGVRFPPEREVALTIGVFDGVHLGHRALIGELIRSARAADRAAAALTFDPPPKAILSPDPEFRQLTTLAERKSALRATGLDLLFTLEFTASVAVLSASDFLTLVCCTLNVREIVVGTNFALGRGREGDVEALAELGRAMGVTVRAVDLSRVGGDTVSSSRIRAALREGDMDETARLLGRPYTLGGPVIHGDERGRTIGFPTANLALDPTLVWPKLGVYAVRAHVDGEGHPAVANIGVRPTFDKAAPLLEVHLLDFDGDLYGRQLRVEFVRRLRDEQRFAGLGELKAQIATDADQARSVLAERSAESAG